MVTIHIFAYNYHNKLSFFYEAGVVKATVDVVSGAAPPFQPL